MAFLPEQHLAAAKLVRKNRARRTGAERKLFIRKSNSFVICVRLMRKIEAVLFGSFDWWSLTPDWSVIDEQVRRLSSPQIDGPLLIPNL